MTKTRKKAKAAIEFTQNALIQKGIETIPNASTQARSNLDEAEIVNVRRRQGRSAETRRKILEGALVEFATAGFEGATTRSIAQRAEVPHALVIYHFETKLGIWQAVVERALAEMHDQFELAL